MSPATFEDSINLRNLHTTAIVGLDAWSRPLRPQPITISISLGLSTYAAGKSDKIDETFSYGTMCKDVSACVEDQEFDGIDSLIGDVSVMAKKWPGRSLEVEIVAEKALLRCERGLGVRVRGKREAGDVYKGRAWYIRNKDWFVRNLKCACIIGVNPHERVEKQMVNIDLYVMSENQTEMVRFVGASDIGTFPWGRLAQCVCDKTEASSFETLEALAALIARTCLQIDENMPRIRVKVEKPSALTFVEGAGVEITRDREWLEEQPEKHG
ncbi:trifunctional dihydropteroate synthetase [Lecanora helva]